MAYGNVVLADRPVSYWRLDEASGTNAADKQGANAGTYTGGFTLGTAGALSGSGDADSAVTLDGSTGYVNVPTSASLTSGLSNFTCEAWVNPAIASQLSTGILTQQYVTHVNYSLNIGRDMAGAANIDFFDGIAWNICADPNTAPLNTWTHFVGTYDGANLILYRNGTQVAIKPTTAAAVSDATAATYIGINHLGPGHGNFNGAIDEVALYNYALTAPQAAAHYTAGVRVVLYIQNQLFRKQP